MIKVNISKKEQEIEQIQVSGHAGYAEYGHDIVCSAVSSIITTSVNGILSFKETIHVVDDAKVLTITVLEHDNITDTLLENMLNVLKEIEKQYKKNITIRTEGE